MYSSQYGKAKLVLKDNKYFIETVDYATMKQLKEFEAVSRAMQEAERL